MGLVSFAYLFFLGGGGNFVTYKITSQTVIILHGIKPKKPKLILGMVSIPEILGQMLTISRFLANVPLQFQSLEQQRSIQYRGRGDRV